MPVTRAVDVVVRTATKVEIGLGTVAGLVAALGQYAGAVGLFLATDMDSAAVDVLTTATVTLVVTVGGRMAQAVAAINAVKPAAAAARVVSEVTPLHYSSGNIAESVGRMSKTEAHNYAGEPDRAKADGGDQDAEAYYATGDEKAPAPELKAEEDLGGAWIGHRKLEATERDRDRAVERHKAAAGELGDALEELGALRAETAAPVGDEEDYVEPDVDDVGADVDDRATFHALGNPGEDPAVVQTEAYLTPGGSLYARATGVPGWADDLRVSETGEARS